jgi:hypothetical protein
MVADQGNQRIQVFDPTGKFLFTFGSPGSGDGQFSDTCTCGDLVVDSKARIIVADAGNHRLQVFGRPAVSPGQLAESQPTLPTEPADAEATEPAAEPVAEPTAAVAITGEAIAYVQDNTLFIRALDGGEAIAVETCPQGSYCLLQYLKWSPDGQRLLYYYYDYNGVYVNDSLRLADRQGNVQTVSDDIAGLQPGAWSPDGRAIAFFRPTYASSETEPMAGVYEVWTAAVPSEDLGAGSVDGAVGALQPVGTVHISSGCGGGGLSQSQALYENEGGTPFGFLMGVTEWTASDILLYTTACGNVGNGRFDMNSGMELEPFDTALRSLVLNNRRDRWYAVTGSSWPAATTDNQLVTGTPDSPAVEMIPTSQPIELVFYGPVSGRLYYTAREVMEWAVLPDQGLYFPFYRSALWTMNPDGTGETLLWQAEGHAFAGVTERPDGSLLFTRVENERALYQAAQDTTITDLAPYAPQRHIMQIPATGGEPVVVIANAGQSSNMTVPTSGPCMNDSVFVIDVNVPDGTHFAPGASFTKTWRLRNSGTCAWDASYQLTFISGERMNGSDSTPLGETVPPGGEVDLSIDLIAPGTNGAYRGQWQLIAPDGTPFGAKPYVEIVVP